MNIPYEESARFLSFKAGDYFSVLEEPSDRRFFEVWGKDALGNVRQGLVPVQLFEEVPKQRRSGGSSLMGTPALPDSGYSTTQSYGRSDSSMTPKTPKHIRMSSMTRGAMVYGVVQYDFNAERPDELEAKAGEAIIVIAQSNPEWFVAKPIGRLGGPGLIPVSFIEVKDMATGLPVPDPQKAVQAAGVPKVEEWKRLAAEYKNSSISLGQLTMPGVGGGSPGTLTQGMAGMSLDNNGPQYSPEGQVRTFQTH
jgi:bud emergence protein 1